MTTVSSRVAYGIAMVAGALGWIAISELTHRREAWDSDLYFSWFLPSMALVAAALGFFSPVRAWRWGVAPFGAQAVVAFAQNPGANLLPLGLIVFGFYGAVCAIPALMGAALRRRFFSGGT